MTISATPPAARRSQPPVCVCFGLGYSAQVFAQALRAQGWQVIGTSRAGGEGRIAYDGAAIPPALQAAVQNASAILASIPPDAQGRDAGLAAIEAIGPPAGAWIGYLSTTGVYGDRAGRWAFEDDPLTTQEQRSRARIAAEQGWRAYGAHVFRLAGIYGPGRSALDRVRSGDARRIIKPGQVFSRIHVDDISSVLAASLAHPNPGRAYNVCDDEPAPPQDVIAFAAELLGAPVPPDIAFDAAGLTGMAASFYAENKRVSNARAKAELGWRPRYPSYREGLHAILRDGG